MSKHIVIIGGGPAGLTAALELVRRGGVRVTLVERETQLGGIARTIEYKGNRMDLGGHRFFSKSETVMRWWSELLPLQGAPARDDAALRRFVPRAEGGPDPETQDRVMLVRSRLSRILFLRRFFSYPVSLSLQTLLGLGPVRVVKMGCSYLRSLFRKREEKSLEDFFINRFGEELYKTFFRDYTEKVWGVPCRDISAAWGAQRVKGLSVAKVLAHAIGRLAFWRRHDNQAGETSLIDSFWYPKYGPGQLWEIAGAEAEKLGADIRLGTEVVGVRQEGGRIVSLALRNLATGETETLAADALLSSAPLRDMVRMMGEAVPGEVRRVAEGLVYRDFMTVGLQLRRLCLRSARMNTTVGEGIVPDNWIYVQENDVKVGRLQLFNNWSPYLSAERDKVWLGMEYFVNEGDELWRMDDAAFGRFAAEELARIGVIELGDVLDTCVVRVPKAYPAYFGSYGEFEVIRRWADSIPNFFPVGRNGMHRYNNMDHSMLAAMEAVACVLSDSSDKSRLWEVNTEAEYHETHTQA